MFYGTEVQDTRQMYFTSWKKYQQKQPLSALEQLIATVIAEHPEYHALMDNPPAHLDQAYFPELGQTNPFLHLGMHLAIREQIMTNRPAGIAALFNTLVQKHGDPLFVEHQMMESLAECLWTAQREQLPPDEGAYLDAIKELTHF